MKMRMPHLVPLSKQAIALLTELQPPTASRSKYVFPGGRSAKQPMSNKVAAPTAGSSCSAAQHWFQCQPQPTYDGRQWFGREFILLHERLPQRLPRSIVRELVRQANGQRGGDGHATPLKRYLDRLGQ